MQNSRESYERVAHKAQQYVSTIPVLVIGTGATIPYGLPSMHALATALTQDTSLTGKDFKKFKETLAKTKDLEITLHDVSLSPDNVDRIVHSTWRLVSKADLGLYHQLVRGETFLALESLFRHLLRTATTKISVVTSNYDRVAEYASYRVNAYVSTGMTAGALQRFVPGIATHDRVPAVGYEGQVIILKVHGSLDWFLSPSGDITSLPLSLEIPPGFRPLVVTPGISKYREVHKDPFRTIIAAADNSLRSASSFLCIGYGFNDEHIQPILLTRVQKDSIPLIVITKTLSQAARDAFLSKPCQEYLLIEEHLGGTRVYCPEAPSGLILEGISLWNVEVFMKMISGQPMEKI